MSAPNLKEVEWAIHELEQEESSKSGYILLSALYNIRDHMAGADKPEPVAAYSGAQSPQPLGNYGDSEFLSAAAGKEPEAVWLVLDELMETLRVVEPRLYGSVLRKVERI